MPCRRARRCLCNCGVGWLGRRSINLLADYPCMPTLREIHRALAKPPALQARLYLLLDELVHRELLCTTAFIGA